MAVKRIWLSGIRMLNTPVDHQEERRSFREHVEALTKTKPLEFGQINMFIGENGSGKSTVIDAIRALGESHVLASLSRENPPKQSFPAYRVEFVSGLSISYVFSMQPLERESQGLDYVGCWQYIERPQYSVTTVADLYKNALYSPLAMTVVEGICYRNGPVLSDGFCEQFVGEINSNRQWFSGLAGKPSDRSHNSILEHSSVHTGEDGMLNVWLADDMRMGNLLRGEMLPSGWKAFVWSLLWLKNCPDKSICLLEEPETHLHPTLMRALLEAMIQIASEKDLQLFISTHSAALLNSAAVYAERPSMISNLLPGVRIFQSHVSFIESKPNLGGLLDRMGYQPADMLLANCVIWVEGPSDRLYLNHWISQLSPELCEGSHYSIMFYGGRLLSHLDAEDSEGEQDLINLTTLNRHCAIVLDSDKAGPHSRINKTKQRVVNAFSGAPERLVWVTQGREIENYLDPDHLHSSIRAVHPSAHRLASTGQWNNLLKYQKPRGRKIVSADKVKVAASYVKTKTSSYFTLDLERQLRELCGFIKRWN